MHVPKKRKKKIYKLIRISVTIFCIKFIFKFLSLLLRLGFLKKNFFSLPSRLISLYSHGVIKPLRSLARIHNMSFSAQLSTSCCSRRYYHNKDRNHYMRENGLKRRQPWSMGPEDICDLTLLERKASGWMSQDSFYKNKFIFVKVT